MEKPGCSETSSGDDDDAEVELNPGEGVYCVEELVRSSCNSCGLEDELYWPGSSWTWTPTPGEFRRTPTAIFQ